MAIPGISGVSLLAAIGKFSEPTAWAELEQLFGLGVDNTEARDGWTENDWVRRDYQVMLMLEVARKRPIEGITALHRWTQLKTAFRARLRSGELVGTGYVKPVNLADSRMAIPSDKWRFLEPDFRDSTASGAGMEIVSILVCRADHVDEAPTKPTIAAETTCRQWIERKAETGEKPANRKSLYDEARTEIGPALSKRAFTRAWATAAPDDWKRPGKKSTRRIDSRGKS